MSSRIAINPKATTCPCDSGKPYTNCCQPCHAGTPAPNAEALMRSRYSAFVLGLEYYLLNTWHPATRPSALHLQDDATKWLGLQVKRSQTTNDRATVEFIARYKVNGKAQRLHEVSRFEQEEQRWYYRDGEQL